MVSLSLDRTARLWDLETIACCACSSACHKRDAEHLRARWLALDDSGAVQVDMTYLPITKNASLAISADGQRAVFAERSTVSVWHLDTGRFVSLAVGEFQAKEVSTDAQLAVVGSILGTLCLVDTAEGRLLRMLDSDRSEARSRKSWTSSSIVRRGG